MVKKLIFFENKDTKIFSFLVEHYTIKTDIISSCLLLTSAAFKIEPKIKLHMTNSAEDRMLLENSPSQAETCCLCSRKHWYLYECK